jgi:hypothetical protein
MSFAQNSLHRHYVWLSISFWRSPIWCSVVSRSSQLCTREHHGAILRTYSVLLKVWSVEVLVEMLQLCSLAKSRTTIVVVDTGGNKHFSTKWERGRWHVVLPGIVVTPFARSPYPLHIYFVYVSSGLTIRYVADFQILRSLCRISLSLPHTHTHTHTHTQMIIPEEIHNTKYTALRHTGGYMTARLLQDRPNFGSELKPQLRTQDIIMCCLVRAVSHDSESAAVMEW